MNFFNSAPQYYFAFVVVCAVVCVVSALVLAVCLRGAGWLPWAACLVPLLLLGKTYATVGRAPFYAMDVLAAFALLSTLHQWGPRVFSEKRLRWFRVAAVGLAVMACQAVYRGIAAGYPGALKGLILGLYPVLGWCAATWFLTRPVAEAVRWRWVLYVPTGGLFLTWALNIPLQTAASGLYLAIAGAFGAQLRLRGKSRLLLWTLVGAALMTAVASKRGPLLAVVAAVTATTLAGWDRRRRVIRLPMLSWSIATMGVLGVLGFTLFGQDVSDMPVVGGLAGRVLRSHDTSTEAGANVELRLEMWREAFRSVQEDPLLGTGAGHPIDVVRHGEHLNASGAGPHNSFVGYVFYLGWPAGIAVVLLVAGTLRRTWRARQHPAAASWFGATVGVAVTAFTNVAFETTYIGLPSWLVLACAFALVGVPREDGEAVGGSRGTVPVSRGAPACRLPSGTGLPRSASAEVPVSS
ncbi:O-antigen ligase family protein [Streptomyces glomeratus]|uniref:O-antigen ligase-related domain-containing protein n=1 Tax=Streptomyces glomeratus TaxID=284452 RepID=A0ABP6LHZ7_9ACTN|nr:O-antigen ligase family protein [Streptomyces glomeratus]MCF1506631.1 O-antigen ligase family protein [Streptomyces glomeratus]